MFIWGTIFSYYICEIKIKFDWQVLLGWLFQPGNGRPRNFLFKAKINKIRRHRRLYSRFSFISSTRLRTRPGDWQFIYFNFCYFCWNGNKRDEIIADFSDGRRSVVYENQSEEMIEQLPMATLKQLEFFTCSKIGQLRSIDINQTKISFWINSNFRHKLNGGRSTFVTLRFLVKCNRE
jgi:hypothetical protein